MQDNKQKVKEIRRGEIWYANLENGRIGSEELIVILHCYWNKFG